MSQFLLGVDCGGSRIRCALVDPADGRVVTAVRRWRPAPAPEAGFFAFDIDTALCWRLVRDVVGDALRLAGARADDVVAVAATGMRFSTVLVDGAGHTLYAVPNLDARAAGQGIRLADDLGATFAARAGHWPAPIFLAPRLCQLAEEAPDLLARAAWALSLNDWLGFRLTGVAATDLSHAAETLLFDVTAGRWAPDLAELLGLPAAVLPPVLAAGARLGGLTRTAAAALGLCEGIPVAVGGGDTQCGLLGAGAVVAGGLAVIAGSTTPVELVTLPPRVDPEGRCWAGRHVIPGHGVLESNAGAMGDALEWFARVLFADAPRPVERFLAEAAAAAPGAGGVVSSLGADVMDARDMLALPTGALSLTHFDPGTIEDEAGRAARGRRDIARAVLEGMAFAVRANAAQLLAAAAESGAGTDTAAAAVGSGTTEGRAAGAPGAVRLAGGLTRGELWPQLVCDVLGVPVEVAATPEASVLGAAVCAGVAGGVFPDLASAAAALARTRRLEPDAARTAFYGELYHDWTRMREARAQADTLASGIALHDLMERAQRETDREAQAAAGAAGAGTAAGGAAAGAGAAAGGMSTSAADAPPSAHAWPPAPGPLRILATSDLDETALGELRELGDVTHAGYREALRLLTGEDLVEALAGYDVFITEIDIVDADALLRLPDLRVIAACRGQAVNVDLAVCAALGIPVLYAPGRNAEAVADLTLAFMLALSRKLVAADGFLRAPGGEAGDMGRMGQAHGDLLGAELWEKTVGLVGLGAVGRAVARRLRPFGARVLVCDPFVPADEVRRLDAEPAALDELLSTSDIVSLHAPLTDETRDLLGRERLARLKAGAFLVNTARAGLVDEDALVEALRSRRLGGAALDVFAVEPPAADDPLLTLPNVIATPHIGGDTVEVGAHQGRTVAADLRRMAAGRPPRHVLNPVTLAGFTWDRARPPLNADTLAALTAAAAPDVTDVQPPGAAERATYGRTGGAPGEALPAATAAAARAGATAAVSAPVPEEGAAGPAAAAAPPAASAATDEAPAAPPAQMRRVLALFLERASTDPALLAFAAEHSIVSQYAVSDLGIEFFIGFADGRVLAGLGAPPEPAAVRLKARGEILDGILSGHINGNKAAMTGKLSFSGDVRLAMGMQRVQKDFERLYGAARAEAGGIDFAAGVAPAEGPTLPTPGAAVPASGAPGWTGPTAGPPPTPAPPGLDAAAPEVREEVMRVTEELFAAQLLTATGGNVSARIPNSDELWITPSQLFKGRLTPDMMVRVGLDGNAADPDAAAPSSERLMHCFIYRARPDVEAVVHAHAAYATILGMAGIPFAPVTTEAAFFGDIPRVPFIMPGSEELAVAARDALGDGSAVLLQNHGLVVAATSLRQAANAAEVIERVSHLIWSCRVAGAEPPSLPDDVLAMLREIGRMMA